MADANHTHSAGWPIGSTLSAHLQDEHHIDQGTLVMSPDWQELHYRQPHAPLPPEDHIMFWQRYYLPCGSFIAYRVDEYGERPSNERLQETARGHYADVHDGDLRATGCP